MRPFMATPHRAGKARGAADTLSLAHRRRTPPTRLPWADAGTGGPTKAAPGPGGAPFEGPGSSLLQGPRRPWRGAWLLTRPAELVLSIASRFKDPAPHRARAGWFRHFPASIVGRAFCGWDSLL